MKGEGRTREGARGEGVSVVYMCFHQAFRGAREYYINLFLVFLFSSIQLPPFFGFFLYSFYHLVLSSRIVYTSVFFLFFYYYYYYYYYYYSVLFILLWAIFFLYIIIFLLIFFILFYFILFYFFFSFSITKLRVFILL